MRILLTGAAGFIGSHLAEHLLLKGHRVVGMDNFLTGRRENLESFQNHPRFRLIHHNVTRYISLDGPLDAVLHFASPSSPVDYAKYPIPTLKVGALGTHNALGLAKQKKALFMLASTSEVYGDPLVNPQKESYWGNVNPIGPRGVYDEAKRFAEALAMAYHREHRIPVRIARIFNSILADQPVVLFNDNSLHIEPVGEYARRAGLAPHTEQTVLIPAFNPDTLKIELRPATALIQHPAHQDAFELRLRYGRSVKVTGDHSVFVKGQDGRPLARPVREIAPGDYVAIPARFPVVERDTPHMDISKELRREAADPAELWEWAVRHPSLARPIEARREEIHKVLERSGRYQRTKNFQNTLACQMRKWFLQSSLPLYVLELMKIETPEGTEIRPYNSSNRWIPDRIPITPDTLWLMGLYLAEGAEHSGDGVHFISLCSNTEYLERCKSILETHFGGRTGFLAPTPTRGPSLYVHSRVLHLLFTQILGLRQRRIPAWIMQLPLSRVKYFLEGFRCGDGTHSGKKIGRELCFETVSEQLALDLNFLLLRFGIVASFGKYETKFTRKYGDRRFPFYRLTVCELDDFDVLTWDRGVRQTLNAQRIGDLVWSRIKEVAPCPLTSQVYDFSVPGYENFIAGNGVFCHNTYGERMRLNDGRAVPNFITQALLGKPLTVYGKGRQTRSLCYISDLVGGLHKLLLCGLNEPVNLGNPEEITVLELARTILRLTGSRSRIAFRPLPQDDPRVRRPDIALARRRLGWKPEVSLEEGLRRTIAYFRADPGR